MAFKDQVLNKKLKKAKKEQKRNKRLQAKAEKLWKEIIRLRDGDVCMVQRHYPNIRVDHTDVYHADHCFSRTIKELFLDMTNGTMLCSMCNGYKGGNKGKYFQSRN